MDLMNRCKNCWRLPSVVLKPTGRWSLTCVCGSGVAAESQDYGKAIAIWNKMIALTGGECVL